MAIDGVDDAATGDGRGPAIMGGTVGVPPTLEGTTIVVGSGH